VRSRDDVISTVTGKGGLFAASAANVVVAVDPSVTPELRAEWYVREVEHFVQGQRKDKGLQVTDRVRVTLTSTDAGVADALRAAVQDIAQEVLADAVTVLTGAVDENAEVLGLDESRVACRLER
jgi:isoleucyl-tRNA synthetase